MDRESLTLFGLGARSGDLVPLPHTSETVSASEEGINARVAPKNHRTCMSYPDAEACTKGHLVVKISWYAFSGGTSGGLQGGEPAQFPAMACKPISGAVLWIRNFS